MKKKKISKEERLKRQREANKLIAFSQMSQHDQLKANEILAEI